MDGWRLRTSFGEEIVVVRARDARKQDEARRLPSLSLRFELRGWLLGPHGFDRGTLMDMFRELRGDPFPLGFPSNGAAELARHVLPVLEEAFQHGRLVALKVPRPVVATTSGQRPDEQPAAGSGPDVADWVEIIVTNDAGEPYLGPYRIDLPDGRSLSGRLNMGGSVRADGIPPGTCAVAFPELQIPLAQDA